MSNARTRKKRRARKGAVVAWKEQATWLINLIEDLHALASPHGRKWKLKMIRHYGKQFANLRENTPYGCVAEGNRIKDRIDAILFEYQDIDGEQ